MSENDVLTEVRFWMQITGEMEKTIVCNPDHESRIKTWIDARGIGGLIHVEVNKFVPIDQVFVIDNARMDVTP